MRLFFKIYLFLIGSLTIAIFSVIMWMTYPFQAKISQKTSRSDTAIVSQLKNIYRNAELGFEIVIPERWKREYKIKEIKTTGYGFGSVAFLKPAEWIDQNTGEKVFRDYMMFGITVVSNDWWVKEMSYDQPHPGFIKINGNKVYIYNSGQDNNNQEYQEIQSILNTFKLTE